MRLELGAEPAQVAQEGAVVAVYRLVLLQRSLHSKRSLAPPTLPALLV